MHPVGIFVLVLATYHVDCPKCALQGDRTYVNVVQVPGFESFQLCESAGIEAQARFNSKTGGDQMDFVCLLQRKP